MSETENILRSERVRQRVIVASIVTLLGGAAVFQWNQRSWLGDAMANPATAFSVSAPTGGAGNRGGIQLAMNGGASAPYLGRRGIGAPGGTQGPGGLGGPIEGNAGAVGSPFAPSEPGAGSANQGSGSPFLAGQGAGGGAGNGFSGSASAPALSNVPGGPGSFQINNGGTGGGGGGGNTGGGETPGGGGNPIDPTNPTNPVTPPVPPVPEPGTWMMMILGIALVGTALRRRRAVTRRRSGVQIA